MELGVRHVLPRLMMLLRHGSLEETLAIAIFGVLVEVFVAPEAG